MTSSNPFDAPATQIRPAPDPVYREQALGAFRTALLILAVPAVLNYAAFDFVAIGLSDLSAPIAAGYRVVNIVALVGGMVAVWTLGLPLLELVSQSIRLVAAKEANAQEWMVPLYFMVRSLVGPAVAGAVLWLVWIAAIYGVGANFMVVSWGLGFVAALLVGLLVVPMAFRWRALSHPEPADRF